MNAYNYNNLNSGKKEIKPKAKKNASALGQSSDNYQRFLEFLEQSGSPQLFKKKILNAHLFGQQKKSGS